MSTPAWYVFGLAIALVLTVLMTLSDVAVHNIGSPNRRRKIVMLAARWGFFCTILVFAWLIDSGRVPYNEPGVWILLAAGVGLSTALFIARPAERKRDRYKDNA